MKKLLAAASVARRIQERIFCMNKIKGPVELDEIALKEASAGGEYLAPGVYVEEVSFRTGHGSTGANLRSDGELVQAVSDPATPLVLTVSSPLILNIQPKTWTAQSIAR